MRRVVVTGMGLVTPLGCGVRLNWERLIAGQSGITRVESFDVSDLNSRVAGQIPRGDGGDGTFNPDDWGSARDRRRSFRRSNSRDGVCRAWAIAVASTHRLLA